MKIRKYRNKDKKALVELWKTVFPNDPAHNEPAGVIEKKLTIDDLVFVAEEDDKIVGACMAGYDGHRGWLYAVAVSGNHRRRGTGTKLIKAAIASLRENGCLKVNL